MGSTRVLTWNKIHRTVSEQRGGGETETISVNAAAVEAVPHLLSVVRVIAIIVCLCGGR